MRPRDPNVHPKDLAVNKQYLFNVGMTPSGGPNTSTPYVPNDRKYVSLLWATPLVYWPS